MMTGKVSPDEDKFKSALSDVVWRFHAYDQYGRDGKKAVKALSKRAPGFLPEVYREQFELNLRLLAATIEAVNEAPKHVKPNQKFSEYSDVDVSYVMDKLHSVFPSQTDEFLKGHLGMVIYWYYLR